jgi:hypothetical protein
VNVFVDNNRSAWQRDRKRPGWDKMLSEMSDGRIRHLIAYHPDRLMRQPKDLEELLSVADSHHITLHGEANRRNLSDPDDRFILRIEVAHACRSSDDTSRRLRDSMDERADAGIPTPDAAATATPRTDLRSWRRRPDGSRPRCAPTCGPLRAAVRHPRPHLIPEHLRPDPSRPGRSTTTGESTCLRRGLSGSGMAAGTIVVPVGARPAGQSDASAGRRGCPISRTSVWPPDHARPQTGEDTAQSPSTGLVRRSPGPTG